MQALPGGQAELRGPQVRHLARVLRAEAGEQYEISDNRSVYLAEIETVAQDCVRFRILEQLPAEAPSGLTLAAALFKFDRFEWMLEKATELGVERIIPVVTARSEKGLERAADKRLERWRKILLESSQQARRARLPEIGRPEKLPDVLSRQGESRYFLDEKPGAQPLVAALAARADATTILVGPEGGWTEAERQQAIDCAWTPVSLGPLILRCETACIAAAAILACAGVTAGEWADRLTGSPSRTASCP